MYDVIVGVVLGLLGLLMIGVGIGVWWADRG